MDPVIEQMLKQTKPATISEQKNRIKEVVQEIVLCGLSRADFFKSAVFYGGTALRIFHGLDRFSEDLDFSLRIPDPAFNLAKFLPTLEKEIRSYGLNFKIEIKEKTKETAIQSAFLKGNTQEHLLLFYADDQTARTIGSNELIKVKFEVDTNPPDFASFETKFRLLPIPYEVALYDMPSLFAGKIHAVICRGWTNRIKGRDLFDYVFYFSQGTPVNFKHLTARLVQTGTIPAQDSFTLDDLKKMLCSRFENIDYELAKQDVRPFITRTNALDIWKSDFFCSITQSLKAD